MKGIRELTKIHTTNGAWDLVVEIRASDLQAFDAVLKVVRELDGVLNSETSILLTSR
ncbi:Lrp/AsnC ligand binding domain-containing protein [Vibrio tritonius]|nr:Lrp/AsnC ligand binding domain-containing protein [Vibrio tritonius]MCA2017319.1 Lrp/AsnC ligand binding domain-containing protein [Vibrio tritonius]